MFAANQGRETESFAQFPSLQFGVFLCGDFGLFDSRLFRGARHRNQFRISNHTRPFGELCVAQPIRFFHVGHAVKILFAFDDFGDLVLSRIVLRFCGHPVIQNLIRRLSNHRELQVRVGRFKGCLQRIQHPIDGTTVS